MRGSPYPILEFDPDPRAKIMAAEFLKKTLPRRCVISFFRESIEKYVNENACPIIGRLHSEILDIPIYEVDAGGEKLALTMPFSTAPGAACTLEELHAMGAEKFIVCGGAGCLRPRMKPGSLVLPTAAVRDEGTSYHYLPPAREVEAPKAALEKVKRALSALSVPYTEGKTWTTDAIYRETEAKIDRRAGEGCVTVEMECAAFFAVAEFYGLALAQLLYAGDDVSGETWDKRAWNKQYPTRENILRLALELAKEL